MNETTVYLNQVNSAIEEHISNTSEQGQKIKLTQEQKYTIMTASIAVGGAVTGYFLFSHFANLKPQLPDYKISSIAAADDDTETIDANTDSTETDNVEPETNPSTIEENPYIGNEGLSFTDPGFSSLTNDSMSFGEAFGLARNDIGSGGFFEWRGDVFSTFHTSEWDNMSLAEQNEFMRSVFNSKAFDSIKDNLYELSDQEEVYYVESDNHVNTSQYHSEIESQFDSSDQDEMFDDSFSIEEGENTDIQFDLEETEEVLEVNSDQLEDINIDDSSSEDPLFEESGEGFEDIDLSNDPLFEDGDDIDATFEDDPLFD